MPQHRERERERERQTDRHRERQRDRDKDREREKKNKGTEFLARFELTWACHKINEDVDGLQSFTEDPALKLMMTRLELVGES